MLFNVQNKCSGIVEFVAWEMTKKPHGRQQGHMAVSWSLSVWSLVLCCILLTVNKPPVCRDSRETPHKQCYNNVKTLHCGTNSVLMLPFFSFLKIIFSLVFWGRVNQNWDEERELHICLFFSCLCVCCLAVPCVLLCSEEGQLLCMNRKWGLKGF